MISNSLDIDFFHGDIHDRSCKKKKIDIPTAEDLYIFGGID